MNESDWTRIVCNTARSGEVFAAVGGVVSTPQAHVQAISMQQSGWPDRHIIHRHWIGWLEFKSRRKLRLNQKLIIKDINSRRPGTAYVVHYPGIIENHDGVACHEFEENGEGLLACLQELYELACHP